MNYYLFSQNKDMLIESFSVFNKHDLLNAIVKHLNDNPTDTIEYCKDYSKTDLKRFAGYQIIAFYEVNPKNNKPSKCILKGEKIYYKAIEKMLNN